MSSILFPNRRSTRTITKPRGKTLLSVETLETRRLLDSSGLDTDSEPNDQGAGEPDQGAIRINAGGPAYTDVEGNQWQADSHFLNGFSFGPISFEIHRTEDDVLFQTERAGKNLRYAIPILSGHYAVNLHFAEIFWDDFGQRVFDISLEGEEVAHDVDIFARARSAFHPGMGTAHTISVPQIYVEDGALEIAMAASTDNAKIAAIEVLPLDGPRVVISESDGETRVAEDGPTDFYIIQLSEPPTSEVKISIDPDDNLATNHSAVSFTPQDWSPRSVVVTAIDDDLAEGTTTRNIIHTLTTTDDNYLGQQVDDVAVVIEDNDATSIDFDRSVAHTIPMPTTAAWGPDGRLYVGTLGGAIHVLEFDDNYHVVNEQLITAIQDLPNSSILGIAFNPFDTSDAPTIYVSHSQLYANGGSAFPLAELSPYSGQVSTLDGPNFDLTPLITGLPVSNHDHGVNGLEFDTAGDLYIAVGGNTNAGVRHGDLGGLDESPLTAAILKANITKPNFNGSIRYELPDDLPTALTPPDNLTFAPEESQSWGGVATVASDIDVDVFASGLRNPYDLIWTTGGRLFSTDNSANSGFGDISTGPETQAPFFTPRAWDELNLIEEGNYYGHPNRNRGREDARQNVYYDVHDEPIAGIFTQQLERILPASGGITEYRATTFDGQMRGDLLVQQWNNTVSRIRLAVDGRSAEKTEEMTVSEGLDILTGPGGAILGVDFSANELSVAQPVTGVSVPVAYDIFPWRGVPGSEFVIGGENFGQLNDTTVMIGGRPAALTSVSDTRIQGILPDLETRGHMLDLFVSTAGHTSTIPDAFMPLGTTTSDPQPSDAIRINAGGDTFTDTQGHIWLEDTHFSGGFTFATGAGIGNTADDTLYQTERAGNFAYNIPVPNGVHDVNLELAEIFFTAPAERSFNVLAEGQLVVEELDLIELTGERYEAATISARDIGVTDGVLDLEFRGLLNNAKISAIEVITETRGLTSVEFRHNVLAVNEGVGTTRIWLDRTGDLSVSTEVVVSVTGGSAEPNDYSADIFPHVIRFAPNESSKFIDVEITGDFVNEPTETIDLALKVLSNPGVGKQSELVLEILDDDATTSVVRINAGGDAFTDSSGLTWQSDASYSGGFTFSTNAPISGTTDDALYQTERAGNFTYHIDAPNGTHEVHLHFAEIFFSDPGERQFDVYAEGELIVNDLDLIGTIGRRYEAMTLVIPNVEITDGELELRFERLTNEAKISAIEVRSPAVQFGEWEIIPPSGNGPDARHEGDYVRAGSTFFLIGGRGSRSVDEYDPAANEWTKHGVPKDDRSGAELQLHHFQAVERGRRVYVLGAFTGGCCAERAAPQIYSFDPATPTSWRVEGEIPTDRLRGSAAAVNYGGTIYLVGGNVNGHNSGAVAWLDSFDPTSGEWTVLSDAPRARDHHRAAVVNHKLYVLGGRRTSFDTETKLSDTVAEVDVYDLRSGMWSTAASPLPQPRAGSALAKHGAELLVISGEVSSGPVGAVDAFNVTTHAWTNYPPLSAARNGSGAISRGNKLYVVAGQTLTGGSSFEVNSQETFVRAPLAVVEDRDDDGVPDVEDAFPNDSGKASVTSNTRRGDADENGIVEFTDFLRLAVNFGAEGGWQEGDFDGDGLVTFSDFVVLAANFA